jgi:hypothetical protein
MDNVLSQLINKRNSLRRRIDKWRDVQDAYMPAVTKYRAQSASPDNSFEHPKTIPLFLPSALPPDVLSAIPSNFIKSEIRLRVSQADDSLHDLKRFLHTTMGLWDFKRTNIGPGQRSRLRAYATISTYQEKVNRCANRYCAAYKVLSTLDPGGVWTTRLQELKSTDVGPPVRDMDKAPKQKGIHTVNRTNRNDPEASEGRRILSWIWLTGWVQAVSDEEEVTQMEINESESHIVSLT